MNNEELIAQARELCERKIAQWQEVFDELSTYGDAQHHNPEINAWTTHLAEMDEIEAKIAEVDTAVTHDYMKMVLGNIYRDFLLTKAKRLLGE
jgi:hypothetical protein